MSEQLREQQKDVQKVNSNQSNVIEQQQDDMKYDTKSINGLRGIGALIIFFYSYKTFLKDDIHQFYQYNKSDTLTFSPLCIVIHGFYQAFVFFTITGYVLPIKYLKKQDDKEIGSFVFKRLFRLLIPFWGVQLLYYLFSLFNISQHLEVFKQQNFGSFILNEIISSWVGSEYKGKEDCWFISVQFLNTLFVACLVQVACKYQGYKYIYLLIIVVVFFIPSILGKTNILQEFGYNRNFLFVPSFFIGTFLSHLESDPQKPLDSLRNLSNVWTIVRNGFLLSTILIIVWIDQFFFEDKLKNIHEFHPRYVILTIAAGAQILLVMTSPATRKILMTQVLQFLGRIAYSLFLIHNLVIYIIAIPIFQALDKKQDFSIEGKTFIPLIVAIPVLIIVSYILTIILDEPSKEFVDKFEQFGKKEQQLISSTVNEDNTQNKINYSTLNQEEDKLKSQNQDQLQKNQDENFCQFFFHFRGVKIFILYIMTILVIALIIQNV